MKIALKSPVIQHSANNALTDANAIEAAKSEVYEQLSTLLQTRFDLIKHKLRNSDFSNERLQLLIRERNRLVNEKQSQYSAVEIFALLVFGILIFYCYVYIQTNWRSL